MKEWQEKLLKFYVERIYKTWGRSEESWKKFEEFINTDNSGFKVTDTDVIIDVDRSPITNDEIRDLIKLIDANNISWNIIQPKDGKMRWQFWLLVKKMHIYKNN